MDTIDKINTTQLERINNVTVKAGGVIMGLSYIPQIFKILSTRSVEGISLMFLVMVTVAVSTFALDGYVIYTKTGEKKTMIAQLLNLVPALITVILILTFR